MEIILRPAVPEDAPVLANIQIQAWNAAFGGILSPEALAQATQLDEVERVHRYVLEHNLAHVSLQCINGTPQGFCAWSANRDNLGADTAELICIHGLPQYWGHGYGSHMMTHLLQEVADAGYSRLVLWVFEENHRARAFYESHGFVATNQGKETLGAKDLLYIISL